jgi:hypothetical protein
MYAGLASAGVKSDGPSFVDVGADRGATIAHFVIGIALRTPAEGAIGALLLGVDPHGRHEGACRTL